MTDSELNEVVAKKLGWKECQCAPQYRKEHIAYMPSKHIVRNYCHSIEAAWEICEKVKNEILLTIWWHDGEWEVDIEMSNGAFAVKDEAAPRAICLAFLKLP